LPARNDVFMDLHDAILLVMSGLDALDADA
jgi:hypothetical protein